MNKRNLPKSTQLRNVWYLMFISEDYHLDARSCPVIALGIRDATIFLTNLRDGRDSVYIILYQKIRYSTY